MVKLLLDRSYDWENQESDTKTKALKEASKSAIIKNSNNVDLFAKDALGNTVFHYLSRPSKDFVYYKSDEILRILWTACLSTKTNDQFLDVKNEAGETPLKIAKNSGARNLVKTIQELLAIEEEYAPDLPSLINCSNIVEPITVDYKTDSIKQIEIFENEKMEVSESTKSISTPDPNVGLFNRFVALPF